MREEQSDLDAAVGAAVNHSSWALSASGEVAAGSYSDILFPHEVIRVIGVGGYLSGDYLITQVGHQIDMNSYSQRFSLRRNARLAGSNAAVGSLSGIL